MATTEALADITVQDITLEGRQLDQNLIEAVVSAEVERQINAANTLTLGFNDPDAGAGRVILQSTLLRQRTVIDLQGLKWELVQVSKNGDTLTAVFEDAVVARLRRHTGFRKAARKSVTRAQFARELVREEPGVRFYCPELTVVQPVANLPKHQRRRQNQSLRTPGFAPGAKLTVKNVAATPSQIDVLDRALTEAWKRKPSDSVLISLVAAITQESSAAELDHGDGTSVGPLQLTSGKGTVKQRMNTEFSVAWYMDTGSAHGGAVKVYQDNPSYTPGQIAQAVQASAFPYAYAQWEPEATKTVSAWKGKLDPAGGLSTSSHPVAEPYEFTRGQPGQPEDTWTCLLRLADEVGWHCWCLGDTVFFMADRDLISSAPRMRIDEQSNGVDLIDFDWDAGKKAVQISITCHAKRWQCPPGSTVELTERMGPVAGRWIVSDITRSLYDDNATITAIRYEAAKPEPLNVNWKSGSAATVNSNGSDAGKRAVQWESQFVPTKPPKGYVFGAKHSLTLQQMIDENLTPPFDCSSFVRTAWAKAAKIDVGGDTYAQIAKARDDSSVLKGGTLMGDDGGPPPGGWQAGDLLFPADHHVAMAVGDGKHIYEAQQTSVGIVESPIYTKVYFWARWMPDQNSYYTGVKPGQMDVPGPITELSPSDAFHLIHH